MYLSFHHCLVRNGLSKYNIFDEWMAYLSNVVGEALPVGFKFSFFVAFYLLDPFIANNVPICTV